MANVYTVLEMIEALDKFTKMHPKLGKNANTVEVSITNPEVVNNAMRCMMGQEIIYPEEKYVTFVKVYKSRNGLMVEDWEIR